MARRNLRRSTVTDVSRMTSPSLESRSDQDNHDPSASGRRTNRTERAMSPESGRSFPTPQANQPGSARGHKRKHVASQTEVINDEEAKFTRYYDPHQDTQQRRDVKRRSRALERDFQENRDDYLLTDNGEGLIQTIDLANDVFREVKQTEDAAIDARLMVNVSGLAYKRSTRLVLGDTGTGIDVELFLSKCISYMRNGGPGEDRGHSTPSQRNRTHVHASAHYEEDEGPVEEALDWECLGQHACFPFNSRPAAPSFLLGPLSVEKKLRNQTQRRPKSQIASQAREAQPDQLSENDLSQSAENQLTTICTRINKHLRTHCREASTAIQRSGLRPEDMSSDRAKRLLKSHRLTMTGGPSLFDYVINPISFGQTIENIFYVSFLIKEGAVGIVSDDDDLPTIVATQARNNDSQRRENTNKQQAVLSMDYGCWQDLAEAFQIREPMIPHRDDEQPLEVEARGWYNQ